MIERAKLNGSAIGNEGLQHIGEGGFTQVVLIGGNADGAQNRNNANDHNDILNFTVIGFGKIE